MARAPTRRRARRAKPAPQVSAGYTVNKRTAIWVGTAFTVILSLAALLKAAGPIGAAAENYVTKKVNARITSLENSWDKDLENMGAKTRALARQQDGKYELLRSQLTDMEVRLQDRMDENRKETIRLIVEAIRKNGGMK